MKQIQALLLGLALVCAQAARADGEESASSTPIEQKDALRAIETPTFMKCFATPRGFFYALVSTAALTRAAILGHSAYKNLAIHGSQKAANITLQLTEVLITAYISHRAFKDIHKTCK